MLNISKLIFIIVNSKDEGINLNIDEKVTKQLIETKESIYYLIKLIGELKSGYINSSKFIL
jgi:hypothetical protein